MLAGSLSEILAELKSVHCYLLLLPLLLLPLLLLIFILLSLLSRIHLLLVVLLTSIIELTQ